MSDNGAGEVWACEPDSREIAGLLQCVRNRKIRVFSWAIGAHVSDNAKFYRAFASHLSTAVPNKKSDYVETVVQMRTIDSLCSHFNLIKMDIEGGELGVFQGGHETWQEKYPCKILWECHPPYPEEMRVELEYLLGCGFRFKYLVSGTTVQPEQFKGYAPCWQPEGKSRAIYDSVPDDKCVEILCNNKPEFCPVKRRWGKSVRFAMMERV